MGVTLGTDLDANAFKVIGLGVPSSANDATTKTYVDTQVAAAAKAADFKPPVRVASTANVTLATPGAAIDGVTLTSGERVLLKNQTTASENGAYIFNGSAALMTRDTDSINANVVWPVAEGTANADTTWWVTTNNPIVVGTTALVISQYAAGAGGTVKKYAVDNATITANTPLTVNHALNTTDIASVNVWELTGSKRKLEFEWAITDANNVTVKSSAGYTSGTLRIVVSA